MTKVKVVNKSKGNSLPKYETDGSAGLDIRADLKGKTKLNGTLFTFDSDDSIIIHPAGRVVIPTGLYTSFPKGYHLDIRPRSGLAIKHGISVLNTPGLIDSDYRDELGVILVNLSHQAYKVTHGDRIGQAVLMKYETVEWEEVDTLDETERKGGLGSTGIK